VLELIVGTAFLLLLIYGCLALAVPLADRAMAGQGAGARILAAATWAAVYLTLVFHALLWLGAFDRLRAGALLLATIVAVRLAGFTHRALAESIRRDLQPVPRALLEGRWTPSRVVYLVAGVFGCVTLARALMLPTVGWDSITYHYVKAGMWVQSGGPDLMRAPGGWASQRGFFGGGEVFTAWAMLPFGNDLLACSVDVLWWGLMALALYVLGGELGLRARHRLAAAVCASFLPAVWDAVGWGYVDLANGAFSLVGVVFAVRAVRRRCTPSVALSLLALALASGIKLTSAPLLAMIGLLLLASVLRAPEDRRRRLRSLLLGSGIGALLVAPWLLSSWLDTGYPLSLPLRLFGVQLGPESDASAWFGQREFTAYTLASEWKALAALFRAPWVNESHLSLLSVLPLVLAPVGFVRAFRAHPGRRLTLCVVLCLVLSTLLFFYSPAFSVIRVEFVWTNGRFLVPVVQLSLLLGFVALPERGRSRDALAGYLLVATLVHFVFAGSIRLASPSIRLVAVGTLATMVGLAVLGALAASRRIPAGASTPTLVLLALALVLALGPLRTPVARYDLLADRNVPADWFRYWWVAARLLDEEPGSHRIAVTGGPWQDGDGWLMYYFMGRDLQSTLHYVPITQDGSIVPFGPDTRRRDAGSVDAWLARLRREQIDYVMSFAPSSIELGWMGARPRHFERVTGHEEKWALFRVLPGAGREEERAPGNSLERRGTTQGSRPAATRGPRRAAGT
jgi:hypothetical protein